MHDEITGGRKLSEHGAQSRFGYKGFSVGQSVFDGQAGAEVRRQVGKLQLMTVVPGKQAAGQIVQLMNIPAVSVRESELPAHLR